MTSVDRRSVLRAAAGGAGLAAGAGVSSGQSGSDCGPCEACDGGSFVATGTSGYIAINTDDPEADGYELPDNLEEPPVTFEAAYSDDGTWEATDVSFANLDPVDLGLPPVDLDFQINVPDGMSGTIDREAGILTVEATLEIFIPLSDVDETEDDITVQVAIENGTTSQSNNMIGDNSGLDTSAASVVIVDNEYTVPETNAVVFGIDVDDVLALPSQDPGRNWFELSLDLEFSDAVPTPPAVAGDSQPRRSGVDNCYDIVTGEGESVSILDVQALFGNLDSPTVQENAVAFNFSGSDRNRVTVFDVQALYNRVGTTGAPANGSDSG